VFAYNAPYFLDATNLSKLTALYALYSKPTQFIDVATYLLFQDNLRPEGASPATIPGISYDINEVVNPDPEQLFPLALDLPDSQAITLTLTPQPTPTQEYNVGDILALRAGTILDNNGNPVPDGTPVEFLFNISGEPDPIRQIALTADGIARTTYTIASSGPLEIHAESRPAQSNLLRFDIPLAEEAAEGTQPVQIITGTPDPTEVIIITQSSPNEPPNAANGNKPQVLDWLIATLITVGIGWAVYRFSSVVGEVRWGVRAGLLGFIGGALGYTYLMTNLPGSEEMLSQGISRGIILVTLLGACAGLLFAMIWRAIDKASHRSISPDMPSIE
jgi:beta-N-acetylhexosaminidase